jgi:hypothetical protein
MTRRVLFVLTTAVAVAFCYLKSFDVAPTLASLSGWTDSQAPNNWVGTTFIADFDSAAEVGAGLDFATARMTISQRS